MLQNHADQLGAQWDKYLSGLLVQGYWITPHERIGEMPMLHLQRMHCHHHNFDIWLLQRPCAVH